MRKTIVWLAACTAAGAAVRAQDRPQTSSELVRIALEQNLELQAARQRVVEAQARMRLAGVRPAPAVEFEATSGRPLGTQGEEAYSMGYVQPIETGAKRDKRTNMAQSDVALAQTDVDGRTRQLVFEVKTSVAEARAARARREALARLLKATEETARLTSARVAEGDAARLEGQLLQTEVARAQAQLAAFSGRARSTMIQLQRVMGIPAAAGPIGVADEQPAESELFLADLQAKALAGRADLRAARTLETQAAAAATLVRAEGMADLTVFARYESRTSAFEGLYGLTVSGRLLPLQDRHHVLSAGLSIPIFGPQRNQGNVGAAAARVTTAQLQREHLEVAIPLEVAAAYQRWMSAREAVAIFRQGVIEQSTKNLDIIRQAYELGQLRLLDVLNEQRRLVDTELAYIDAQLELAEAAAELERAVGSDLL